MERKTAIRVLKDHKNWAEMDKRIVYAEALNIAINSLQTDEAYALMYEAPEEVTDVISRKAVIDLCKDVIDRTDAVDISYEVRRLPNVIPKRMRAKWEFVQYDANPKIGNYHCSNCRATFQADGMDWEYCPRCGFYMRENG